jgi:multiple sugar transport system permease protein
MGKRASGIVTMVFSYAFLSILTVFILYPLLYVVLGSFKQNQELLLGGANLIPRQFIFDNYVRAWNSANFSRYTINSIFLSFFVMTGVVLVSSMSGYCFARKEFPLKNIIYGTLIAFMFVSIGSVSIRPLFEVALKAGLHKSLWGVILITIGTTQASNIFLVRGYINSIPNTLDDAAKIDGCSFFGIYWRILLPLMVPILATIALLSFRTGWNEYMLPNVFTMSNPDMRPLTVGVVMLKTSVDGSAAAWDIMFAGATMSILPIVVIYAFTSKYFITGLVSGAVKG